MLKCPVQIPDKPIEVVRVDHEVPLLGKNVAARKVGFWQAKGLWIVHHENGIVMTQVAPRFVTWIVGDFLFYSEFQSVFVFC